MKSADLRHRAILKHLASVKEATQSQLNEVSDPSSYHSTLRDIEHLQQIGLIEFSREVEGRGVAAKFWKITMYGISQVLSWIHNEPEKLDEIARAHPKDLTVFAEWEYISKCPSARELVVKGLFTWARLMVPIMKMEEASSEELLTYLRGAPSSFYVEFVRTTKGRPHKIIPSTESLLEFALGIAEFMGPETAVLGRPDQKLEHTIVYLMKNARLRSAIEEVMFFREDSLDYYIRTQSYILNYVRNWKKKQGLKPNPFFSSEIDSDSFFQRSTAID